jgi:large subunit ribosomal protein L9
MKVILLQNVKDLGRTGEIKDVADGYARNFLFLRKLAAPANAGIVTAMQSKKDNKVKQEERAKETAMEMVEKLKKIKIEIRAKSDEKGTLFAAVGDNQILEELKKRGYKLTEKQIKISEPIKKMGEHEVGVDLGFGLETKVKVKVVRLVTK